MSQTDAQPSSTHTHDSDCNHDHGYSQGHHDHDHGHDSRSFVFFLFTGLVFLLGSLFSLWLYPENRQVSDFAAVIGAVLLAIPIFKTAVRDLMHGHMHFEEFVALGILAAMAGGDFRAAGVIAFFMLIAEFIEHRTAAGAHRAIEGLVRLAPSKAVRLSTTGAEQEVAAADLRVGDRIRISPGDNVSADGRIVLGRTTLNEATITGESLPRDKQADDDVYAGTTNLTGMIEVEVTKVGEDTTLGQVKKLILEAEQTKIPLMKIIDKYARYYTPVILILAAVIWFFSNDWGRVVALLVMACPCAFILSTPTAMVAALASAARRGILVKNMVDFEAAARIDAVILDKTGTLTTGELGVVKMQPAKGVSKSDLLFAAASAERYSKHPAGKALIKIAETAGLKLDDPQNVQEIAGAGVAASIQDQPVLAGRRAWLQERGIDIAAIDQNEDAAGLSLVHVARNGRYLGWIGLRDQVRNGAREAIMDLKQLDIKRIRMLTGDRESVASRIADELGGCEFVAECLPQEKAVEVEKITAEGYATAFVGDGANDAPALAASRTGIAMGAAGNDIAIHSATVALMNNELSNLPFLIRLSRAAKSTIYQNLAIAGVLILGGFIVIGFGYLTAILAAVLHNIGSLIVVFNSARLVRFEETEEEDLGLFDFETQTSSSAGFKPQP